jgi:hypothetical protein
VFTKSGTHPWSFVTQIFHNGPPCHGGDRKAFEVMTSASPRETICSVTSFLTGSHCQFRGVGKGMKQTFLYLWYPLFQDKWVNTFFISKFDKLGYGTP